MIRMRFPYREGGCGTRWWGGGGEYRAGPETGTGRICPEGVLKLNRHYALLKFMGFPAVEGLSRAGMIQA